MEDGLYTLSNCFSQTNTRFGLDGEWCYGAMPIIAFLWDGHWTFGFKGPERKSVWQLENKCNWSSQIHSKTIEHRFCEKRLFGSMVALNLNFSH